MRFHFGLMETHFKKSNHHRCKILKTMKAWTTTLQKNFLESNKNRE